MNAGTSISQRTIAEAIAPAVNPTSQNGKVLGHLLRKGSITQVEAHELYRVYRLASRMNDLKNLGVLVLKNLKIDNTGVRYVEYSL